VDRPMIAFQMSHEIVVTQRMVQTGSNAYVTRVSLINSVLFNLCDKLYYCYLESIESKKLVYYIK
jgi:hypothetical protein